MNLRPLLVHSHELFDSELIMGRTCVKQNSFVDGFTNQKYVTSKTQWSYDVNTLFSFTD